MVFPIFSGYDMVPCQKMDNWKGTSHLYIECQLTTEKTLMYYDWVIHGYTTNSLVHLPNNNVDI